MPYQTITLSSVGTSGIANLDWSGGKPTTVAVSAGSTSMASNYTIQYTLDDIMRTASTSVVWFSISSAAGSSAQHFTSSLQLDPGGVVVTFLNPIAAVRINSTALSSTNLQMRVLQGEGA